MLRTLLDCRLQELAVLLELGANQQACVAQRWAESLEEEALALSHRPDQWLAPLPELLNLDDQDLRDFVERQGCQPHLALIVANQAVSALVRGNSPICRPRHY